MHIGCDALDVHGSAPSVIDRLEASDRLTRALGRSSVVS